MSFRIVELDIAVVIAVERGATRRRPELAQRKNCNLLLRDE
jgi:hypothetical protein